MNSPKPMAAKASITVCNVRTCLSRANADSTDIGVGPGVDDLAEHVLHLELAAGRLRDAQREERRATSAGRPRTKNAQRHPSSPPGERGDAADQRRADGPDQQAACPSSWR